MSETAELKKRLRAKLDDAINGDKSRPVILSWQDCSAAINAIASLTAEAEAHKTDAEFWKYNHDLKAAEIARLTALRSAAAQKE